MTWQPDLDQLAEEVKHAPSIFNSQPWFFKVTADDRIEMYIGNGINLYVSPDNGDRVDPRRLDLPRSEDASRLDPLAREFVISCGAALYNLRLAIRVAGHDLAVRLPPHPTRDRTLLASVEIITGRVKAPTNDEQELYEAIWRRHTNRQPYTIIPAPLPIIVAMENAAFQEGASLRLLHRHQARTWLDLAAEADRFFREEKPKDLSSSTALRRYQMHQAYRSRWVKERGGVPATTFGPTPKWRDHLTREDFWLPEVQAFEAEPQLMALSTDDDQILDWLRAGQALQHAILTGTRYSVSPPYGLAAKYHAPYRYGLPGRHHLVRRWRRDLAYDGLSVSLLTQPLERYDIVRYDTARYDTGSKDTERKDAALRPRPLPWRVAELPQVVIRVGYAVQRTGVAPRQPEEQVIVDARLKPPPGVHHVRVQLPEPELS